MATLDVLTAAEALSAVNGRSSDATELAYYTEAVSLALDYWCGPVVQRTITSETLDGDGTRMLRLTTWPILSVTSVTEYGTALTEETDATSPPSDGFRLTTYSQNPSLYGPEVIRRSGGGDSTWYKGRGTIVVTYEAGRYATTAAVSERFKAAARITLANLWRSQQLSTHQMDEYDVPAASFPKFGLPNAAKHLLIGELHLDPSKMVTFA